MIFDKNKLSRIWISCCLSLFANSPIILVLTHMKTMLTGLFSFLDTCTYDKVAYYENGTNVTLEKSIECHSWDYDTSIFQSTIMSEVLFARVYRAWWHDTKWWWAKLAQVSNHFVTGCDCQWLSPQTAAPSYRQAYNFLGCQTRLRPHCKTKYYDVMYFLVVTEWGNMECLWFYYLYWWEVSEKICKFKNMIQKLIQLISISSIQY